MRRVDRLLACLALLVGMATVSALPLAPEHLPAAQREPLLALQATWDALPPARRQALRQRMAHWQALPVAVRTERRARWRAWRALPAEQQVQLRAAAGAFAASPVEQRSRLRQRFDALDSSEQRGWMLGPVLGADYVRLQPLLAQVPAAEREPLLGLLRTMSVGERNDLAMLAQRIAPQARDALRRGLLATPASGRAAWLQLRLQQ